LDSLTHEVQVFLLTTQSWIAVVNHSKPSSKRFRRLHFIELVSDLTNRLLKTAKSYAILDLALQIDYGLMVVYYRLLINKNYYRCGWLAWPAHTFILCIPR